MPARATRSLTGLLRASGPWAALAAACGLIACVDAGSAAAPRSEDDPAPAHALQEGSARPTGVPPGCTREWNYAIADSVLNCPDIRPPSPQ